MRSIFLFGLFTFSLLLAFFYAGDISRAATITWDGGGVDELWSTANNWSGNYVPNATDTVVFSASSTKSVTINQNVTVQGININSTYSTGTISQGTSTVILSSNGFTMASGTWIGGSGMIDINDDDFILSGGYFSAPSSSATFTTSSLFIEQNFTFTGGTFSAANTTTTFDAVGADNSTLTCTGTLPGIVAVKKTSANNVNFTLSSGCTIDLGTSPNTVMANSGSVLTNRGIMNATGTWTHTNGTLNTTGTIVHGGSSWTMSAASFTHASTATTTYNGAQITIMQDFTFSGGTFTDQANKLFIFSSNNSGMTTTFTCTGNFEGSVRISKSTSNSGSSFTLASGCNITLETNTTSTFSYGNTSVFNGNVTVPGTWIVSADATSPTILRNNGTLTHSGSVWDLNDIDFENNGTTTYAGSSTTIEKSLKLLSGTMDLGGGLVVFDSSANTDDSFILCNTPTNINASIQINKTSAGATTTIASNCTVNKDFTRTRGVLNGSSSEVTLTVHGNLSVSSTDTAGDSNLTILFSSSGIQYASSTGVPWGGPIQVNTSSTGELRLASALVTSSTCSVGGVFNLNSRNFTCGSTFTVQGNGILKLQGAETVTAPTLSSSSTLVFTGDGDGASDSYTITTYATSTHHLIVSSTDTGDSFLIALPLDVNGNFQFATGTIQSSTTISIAGNWTNTNGTFSSGTSTVIFDGTGTSVISGTSTFYNLQSVTAGKTLNFAAGQTQTVTSTLTLTGSSGNPVTLRSTTDGTSWLLNAVAASVSYVDVKDSTNSGTSISCDSTCTNSGNNSGWTFPAASSGGGGGGSGGSSPQSPSSGSFSVSINGGDSTTTSTKVFLTFVGGSDSVYIDFGEDSTFSSNSYTREFYHMDRVYPYTLKSGGGVKTIYGRFFTSNLTNPTQTFSDSITYIPASSPVATSSLPQAPVSTSTPPSLPLPSFVFTTPLYLGLESDDVRSLQSFLAKDPSLYPQGLITGFFGPLTKAAVGRFQCRYTILCDSNDSAYGYVGPKTRAKLNELMNQSNDPKILQETIKMLQRQIEELMKLLLQR